MNLKFAVKYALATVVVSLSAGCDDDPFGKGNTDVTDGLFFEAEVASSWHNGMPVSRSGSEQISVDETLSSLPDGTQLYLVTEVHALDNVVAEAGSRQSRGSQINKTEDFPTTFGLSGFCYTGDFADYASSEILSNFVSDMEMKKEGYPADKGVRLDWPGAGSSLRFYAYAPYSSRDNGLTVSSDRPRITYTVNSDVKKQVDLLTAVSGGLPGSGSGDKVKLSFGHALSAVTFTTGDAMAAGKVTGISISGVYGTGTTLIGSGEWTTSGTPSVFTTGEISIDLSSSGSENVYVGSGQQITGGKENLTMFMIPQTLPQGAKLTVKFTDALSNSSWTVDADISGVKWEPGKLYKYSLSTSGVVVTPVVEMTYAKTRKTAPDQKKGYLTTESEVEIPYSGVLPGVSVKSYLRIAQAGKSTEAVVGSGFKVKASTDDGKTWTDCVWEPEKKVEAAAGTTVSTSKGTLLLEPQSNFNQLKTLTEAGNGTEDSPVDLSGGGETANCYRVSDHGYYKFPLYYGNARNKDGSDNTKAYTIQNDVANRMLCYVDHRGEPVTKAKISDQIGAPLKDAVLVWEDAPGLISDVKLDGDFVSFHVGKHTLTQGNALIAVHDQKGDIAWSWHIWCTDTNWESDLKVVHSDGGNGAEYRFTSSNLGYCDPHDGNASREVKLKFILDYKDENNTEYEVTKIGDKEIVLRQDEIIASLAGDNTYFQWGRKDPMLPGVYDGVKDLYYTFESEPNTGEMSMLNKPYFYPESSEKAFGAIECIDGASLVDGILHPNRFFIGTGNYRQHWHNGKGTKYFAEGTVMHQAWDSSSEGIVSSIKKDVDVTKTIYDPCP
ncbi:MAG: fimbrillin family protein, partial [Muribaculaceae bacterium]|nr:fimbrillin family protein [Muribaculaceae bacterium]